MKLSIIIPVYNEEKTIKQVLNKVLSVKLPRLIGGQVCQKEIIVVDDGSIDGTRDKILRYIEKPAITSDGGPDLIGDSSEVEETKKRIKVIHHPKNLGKGAAIRSGIKHAKGDYILVQDADLEYNPEEIPKLLEPVLNKKTSKTPRGWQAESHDSPEVERLQNNSIAVYGSRFRKNQAVIPLLYLIGNKFLTLLTNLLYGTKLTDMETGYKLLPASFIKKVKLRGERFEIEPEITVKLVKNKIPIVEVPISYSGRTHLAGKKLTFKDAFGAIKTLLYYRLL